MEGRAQAGVFRITDGKPIDRGGGVTMVPLVGESEGAREMLTGVTLIPAGAAVPLHTHNTEECITVLEGSGICEIDGRREEVEPFDVVFVPPSIPHRFKNEGDSNLRIQWVYGAINMTRTLVEEG